MPGVDLVLTAADLDDVVGVMQGAGPEGLHTPAFGPLASDRVRFVGDPVAIVVAASRALAEDACERVDVTYDPLPALADVDTALASEAPAVFDAVGHNLMFEGHWTYGDPDAHFAAASRTGRWRFTQHRQCNAPLEGRAGLVDHDLDTGDLTYHAAHQNPHALRLFVADLLGIPAHRFHVRVGDVGGSFGQKAYVSREDVAVCAAGTLLGQPVKWVEDRVENLQAAGQAREERFDVEAAYDDDGTVRAVRVDMVFDQGAYQLTTLPPTIFPTIVRVLFPGAYRLRDLEFRVRVVATNKATYVAYRGPWEAETFVRERMLDEIAADVGLAPEVVRERNLLTSDELPTRLVTDVSFAHVTARETFERALSLADVDGFRRAQDAARADGRLLGFGLATFVEPSPGPPDYTQALGAGAAPRSAQRATARLEPDGSLTIFTSQSPHGQGHHTTLAQLAADELGVPLAVGARGHRRHPGHAVQPGGHGREPRRHARERRGDRGRGRHPPPGRAARGTPARSVRGRHRARRRGGLGARGAGGGAVAGRDRDRRLPHHRAAPAGPHAGHRRRVRLRHPRGRLVAGDALLLGRDRPVDRPRAHPPLPGGRGLRCVDQPDDRGGPDRGRCGAGHRRRPARARRVRHRRPTAHVDLRRLPAPDVTDIPPIEIHHLESPPQGPVDFRGVGEGGAIGAPAALCNAIADALRPSGAVVLEQHLPPTKILELLGHF